MGGRSYPLRTMGLVCAVTWLACFPAHASTTLDLGAYKGRVVYLDFWASWCAPCRHSFPWMEQLRDTYGPKGLTIVAVDVDASHADAERFLQQFNPRFKIRFDPSGSLAANYKVEGMPTSFMIDRHGVVRYTQVGFRPRDQAKIEGELRILLDEK